MTKTRTIDNSNRPAQPEPGEDPAVQSPAVREQGGLVSEKDEQASERAQEKERKRQTGEE